jgi:hypothetical protein
MSEKALAIGAYFAASGVYVLFGVNAPTSASANVVRLMSEGWENLVGGKMEFVPDPDEIVKRSLAHIDAKRAALKLPAYEPGKFGASGDERIQELLAKHDEERKQALYGWVHAHAEEHAHGHDNAHGPEEPHVHLS